MAGANTPNPLPEQTSEDELEAFHRSESVSLWELFSVWISVTAVNN